MLSRRTIRHIRLNRNILECKYFNNAKSVQLPLVLIETYWNVNVQTAGSGSGKDPCLNRNILECKLLRGLPLLYRLRRLNRNILECKFFSLFRLERE